MALYYKVYLNAKKKQGNRVKCFGDKDPLLNDAKAIEYHNESGYGSVKTKEKHITKPTKIYLL